MVSGMNIALAVVVALLIGCGGTFFFMRVQLRRDITAAGIVALSELSWRVFIHMVLDAMARRGFTRVVDAEAPSGDKEYLLQCGPMQWLLSCKHGSSFVLGPQVVEKLGSDIAIKGAQGGFLVTQGSFTREAVELAPRYRIELLDGQALWPELRSLMTNQRLDEIRTLASARARQRSLLCMLAGVIAAACVLMWSPLGGDEQPLAVRAAAAPAQPASTPAAPTAPASAADAAPVSTAPSTPEDIARQRSEVARALATLPEVQSAAWLSQSTLEVQLSRLEGDAFARICPIMERYQDVVSSRIQLTPPPGSNAHVRFRQCRVY